MNWSIEISVTLLNPARFRVERGCLTAWLWMKRIAKDMLSGSASAAALPAVTFREGADSNQSKELVNVFVKALKENNRSITILCYRFRDNDADRKDLKQEVLLHLWESYPSFRNESDINTWIHRIAVRRATAPFYGNSLEIEDVDVDAIPSEPETMSEVMDRRLFKLQLRLGPVERQILALMVLDFDIAKTAITLQLTEMAVRKRMSKIRREVEKEPGTKHQKS